MTQIKDNLSLRAGHDVNLGAVPDAGATPLAGGLPETGAGSWRRGYGRAVRGAKHKWGRWRRWGSLWLT